MSAGEPLSFKECERLIGHCWEGNMGSVSRLICRHCGAIKEKEWKIKEPPS